MRRTILLSAFAATALSLVTLSGPALAKGGQDNLERQAQLQAEFAKQKKATQSATTPSFFERLFGTSSTQSAEAPAKKSKATKTSTE